MFTETLINIYNSQDTEMPKYPATDEEIKKMLHIYIQWKIFSHEK